MPGGGCQPVVESALELGYRHIDTAEMYQNEEAVGAAIAASGLARKQLHLTTKVWHENLAPESLRRALDASLGKLGVDYVDLYTVHWPSRDMDLGAVLQGIGVKHGATAAQVALAWLLEQDGVAVIPKAQRRESQKSNLDATTVKLDDDDRHAIAVLPKDHRFVTPPFAPDWDR